MLAAYFESWGGGAVGVPSFAPAWIRGRRPGASITLDDMEYVIEGSNVLMISIVVLFVGTFLTQKIALLDRYSIPPAVTGGILCSTIVALLYQFQDVQITFDNRLRDLLL